MSRDVPFGRALRERLGAPQRARPLDSSPRSHVWQVELAGVPAIVKQVVGGADAGERFAREAAALRLAGRGPAPVVPALLGTDPDENVLVLERLDHRHPGDDWIVGYAAALARLHAATGPGDAGALPRWVGPTRADADAFLALATELGVAVPVGASDELHGLVTRLGRARGHALLHGDPCPGNDLHTADGVRFIDLEGASLGHGLMELAYLHIGFPTCWCVTAAPAPLLERAAAAYRSTWHAATGTPLGGDLADACAGWLIRGDALVQRARRGPVDHLARIPHEDWTWGTVSARERLAHRLGVVAELAADRPALSGLGRLCTDMRAAMHLHWPALAPPPKHRPEP
ncbi:fructosamine-3-kinase [Murinocardiopsis flavida]|uniref:Fructosamine-3-kinase n=1 Tax=Murinocardiopsis flavida TaxID=645275 RepID=A0A2P8CZ10_9ACTN|nr:aminoglycoside phosphotransferase [Murinocardiopsis flavida]PSK90209.1 fructosamine-3-kinase [Murinocardiopsis flavida]